MASDKLFHGVIPALVTPFKEDGALDLDAVAAIVEAQIGDGVKWVASRSRRRCAGPLALPLRLLCVFYPNCPP